MAKAHKPPAPSPTAVIRDPERAIANTVPSKGVMARIRGADLLTRHLGRWPTFHDFEVVSISLERSPFPDCIARDLKAVFFVYDVAEERKPALAELLFQDIDELKIDGFNYQNPIMGLGLRLVRQEHQRKAIAVEWGGTLMHHEVCFLCDRITVVRVTDIDPFGKKARKQ